VTEDGVAVQCVGGRILLKRVRPKGADKLPAVDWASTAGVEKGTRLGT